MKAQDVLNFWFKELTPEQWYKKDPVLDQKIKEKFSQTLALAREGELSDWRTTPQGRLAEIIVLDQFSRNIYRDMPEAFSNDAIALNLSQEFVLTDTIHELNDTEKAFAYMPFMHSESTSVHQIALKLFEAPGLEKNLKFEIDHKAIIDRFGRYPHRNKILNRISTPEEIEFMKTNPGY